MQAIILAGGKGTRLKPYTISFPKPLVPIGDYPILEVVIRQLSKGGFQDIVISTGHLAELIEAYFGNGSRWGVTIRYVREDKPLSTAGALKLVDGLQDNFLVMNGDLLTSLNYRKFFDLHLKEKAAATIATKKRESLIDFGVIDIGGDGCLEKYTEKPVYNFSVSMGMYVLSRNTVELIKKDEVLGMPDLLLRVKKAGQKVFCFKSEDYWLDIGRISDYETAQEEFNSKKELFLGSDA